MHYSKIVSIAGLKSKIVQFRKLQFNIFFKYVVNSTLFKLLSFYEH